MLTFLKSAMLHEYPHQWLHLSINNSVPKKEKALPIIEMDSLP